MSISNFINRIIKAVIITIVLLGVTPNQSYSFSFIDIGNTWLKITTPICTFIMDGKPVLGGMSVKVKSRQTYSLIGYHEQFLQAYKIATGSILEPHTNILSKIATLGNKESLQNLNSAYLGARYLPYSVFTYSEDGKPFYWALRSDACSVLLYGYSWLINIPAKILEKIDFLTTLRDRDKTVSFSSCFLIFFEILFNACSLVIEIPIAIANTMVGTVIALVAHPLNSICSILGFFYFATVSTIVSLWDVIANCLSIISNIF